MRRVTSSQQLATAAVADLLPLESQVPPTYPHIWVDCEVDQLVPVCELLVQPSNSSLCILSAHHADCMTVTVGLVSSVVQAVGIIGHEGGVQHCRKQQPQHQ